MATIEELRKEVDLVHTELHVLLSRRRDLTLKIWQLKKSQGLPFFSPDREEEILKEFVKQGGAQGSDPEFDQLLTTIMKTVLREYEQYLKIKIADKN